MEQRPNISQTDQGGRTEGRPSPLASSAGDRIATIIDAVERAAEGVIDDAEAQAQAYLANARRRADRIGAEKLRSIDQITGRLFEQADEVRRQTEALISAFQEAAREVEVLGHSEAPDSPARPQPPEVPPESGVEPRSAPVPRKLQPVDSGPDPFASGPAPEQFSRGSGNRAAGTRLLVTQMAMAGSSRGEIRARLRDQLGEGETEQIIDSILGPDD